MSKIADKDYLIKEVLTQGYIYAIVDTSSDGTQYIKKTNVYALVTKRISSGAIVSFLETDCGDFDLEDYTSWWWLKAPELSDQETPAEIKDLAQTIIDSNETIDFVDRLYWTDNDSSVKKLAKFLVEKGWHK